MRSLSRLGWVAVLAACEGHTPPPAARTPAPDVGKPSASLPARADVDAGLPVDGPRLVRVEKRTLSHWPDAWDREGRFMAIATARCHVWRLTSASYLGAVDRAVCNEWRDAVPKSPDGTRRVRFDGTRAFVEGAGADGGTASIELLEKRCARNACSVFSGFAWRPRGDEIATFRAGETAIAIWNAADGKPMRTLKLNDGPTSIAWNEEDELVAITDELGTGPLYVWKGGEGAPATKARAAGRRMDPYGRLVASAVQGDTDIRIELEPQIDRLHDTVMLSSMLAPEFVMNQEARGAADAEPLPDTIDTPPRKDNQWIPSVAWGADDAYIEFSPASEPLRDRNGEENVLRWSGETVGFQSETYAQIVRSIASHTSFRASGAIAEVSSDGALVAFHAADRVEVKRTDRPGIELFLAGARRFAFEPGEAVLAVEVDPGKVRVQDIFARTARFESKGLAHLPDAPWSPDGASLATLDASAVTVWNASSWTKRSELRTPTEAFAFDATGTRAVTMGKGGAQVWNVTTGALERALPAPPADAPPLGTWARAVWPGDAREAGATIFGVSSKGRVVVWDLAKGSVRRLKTELPTPMALAPDGKLAVIGRGWIMRTSDEAMLLTVPGAVRTPEGAFDGDPASVSMFAFRLGDEPLTSPVLNGEEAQQRLHVRSLARAFLDGQPVALPESFHAPMVGEAPAVSLEGKKSGDGWDVVLRVDDRGAGIDSVVVRVDDRVVAESDGATRAATDKKSIERALHVVARSDPRTIWVRVTACAPRGGPCAVAKRATRDFSATSL